MTAAGRALHGTPIRTVLDRLKRVRRSAAGYSACCPAHDDRSPSLSVAEGDDGRVLLTCHRGCALDDIVRALGMTPADLFPPKAPSYTPPSPKSDPDWWPVVETYEYRDADGRLVQYVDRRESPTETDPQTGKRKKTFRPRLPDGRRKHPPAEQRVLYRLAETIEAIALGRRIYIVEGERCADTLVALGLHATTAPGGAKSPWQAQYSETLRGAHAIVVPDNDEPGRERARTVADALGSVCASIRILELPGLAKPTEDVVEWLGVYGHTVEELETLATDAPPWRDENPYLPTCALHAPAPAPIGWEFNNLWTAGDYGVIAGEDGSFKTTLAIHMAGAKAGGYPVFDQFPCERRPCLIISAEDPAGVLLNRLEAFIRGHGWDRSRVLEYLHYFASPDVSLGEPRWRDAITSAIERIRPGFVIADPLADIIDGDESSNTDAREHLRFLRSLTQRYGCALAVLAHFGKPAEGKSAKDRVRGASAWVRGARVVYTLEAVEGGIAIQNPKLSRAEKLKPFVAEISIEAEPTNRAVWKSAHLAFQTSRQAATTRGERFIEAQLRAAGKRLTTTELKDIAKGSGVRAEDISTGLNTLRAKGVIDHEPGKNNAKLWGLT